MTSSNSPNTGGAEGFAGFGKFVPGFDFLQNLVAQTAANAAQNSSVAAQPMPGLGSWIAPTLNVEELDRRIKELKTVQFWLDQNATALKATITALEVQKMTLSTLKDMNFNMTEVANAFKINVPGAAGGGEPVAPEKGKSFAGLEIPATVFGHHATAESDAQAAAAGPSAQAQEAPPAAPAASQVDPMQWWGALTQQFQSIAADALKDVAQKAAAAPLAVPDDQASGPVSAASRLADQAAAAMAAGREALAQSTRKTLAGGVALMGKSFKQPAWPMPGAAGADKKVTKKPAAKTATPAAKNTRLKATAPQPARAALKKAPVNLPVKRSAKAPATSAIKPSAARKAPR